MSAHVVDRQLHGRADRRHRHLVGDTTSYGYGINNRFYAKRRLGASQAQEIVNVEIRQTYYTDARHPVPPPYSTNTIGAPPNNFSPIRSACGSRRRQLNATIRRRSTADTASCGRCR